jgi:acyl-CoA synthetase (NDP forming)
MDLNKLLKPRSIALVGASSREHSAGLRILRNLKQGPFPGHIYPVNPRHDTVEGLPCYPSLERLPEVPDAVFLAIPAREAVSVLAEAGRLGVGAALMNATGFADAGDKGAALQRELVATAHQYGIAVCGPNNSGFINLWDRIYPSTFYTMPRPKPGPVAVITQSGSVAIALLQDDRRIGLGYIITAGNEAVCGVGDYLDFVLADDRITIAMMFIETLRDPQHFRRAAAKAHALGKRIVVTKAGRTEAGRAAVAAHSGALAGDDDLYDAFLRDCGVIRARDLDEMIETAALLTKIAQPPCAPGLAVITISGGEASLIADLCTERGLSLPALSAETVSALRPLLSPTAIVRNPVDAMGLGWESARFGEIVTRTAADPAVGAVAIAVDASGGGLGDAVLVREMALECVSRRASLGKPLVFFTNTIAGGPNSEIEALLRGAGIPILCGMRTALGALHHWVSGITPRAVANAASSVELSRLHRVARDALGASESERYAKLQAIGVPMVPCVGVRTPEAARAAARRFGYPVVLKGTAPDIFHKTEAQLVHVNLRDEDQLIAAFVEVERRLQLQSRDPKAEIVVQPMLAPGIELLVAVRNDPQFGSTVVVGLGGALVEVIQESSVRIGPVSSEEARTMLLKTRAGVLLSGVRGKGPYDIDAAARAIESLSRLGAAAHEVLSTLEINPLIVHERDEGVFGVDILIEPVSASPPEHTCPIEPSDTKPTIALPS